MATPPDEFPNLRVATPCPMKWRNMEGNDQIRFCGRCRKNVHNLSAMTAEEVQALFKPSAAHQCVRFFRRADGTIVTADCPPIRTLERTRAALQRALSRTSLLWAPVAALLLLVGVVSLFGDNLRRAFGDATTGDVLAGRPTPPIAGAGVPGAAAQERAPGPDGPRE